MTRSLRFLVIFFCFGADLVIASNRLPLYQNRQSQKMKILMVVMRFPTLSETFVVNQIIGLLDKGHDVRILALKKNSNKAVVNDDVNAYNLMSRTYYKLPEDIASYDVIVSQFGTVGIEVLNRLNNKKGQKTKLATFFRGYDISSFLALNPQAYDTLFQVGDLFLTDCEFFKNRLLSLGVDSKRIAINYSSIQSSRFKYSVPTIGKDGLITVVTVSRLVEKKGIEDALQAMQQVMSIYPNVRYTIIGDGSLKETLEQLAANLGIASKVTFTGAKSPVEIATLLGKSHIFVLPCVVAPNGDVDAIPSVLKEAMSCGLPVVTTYTGGIPEMILDGKTGYLVQQHDVQALTEKIALLVEHPEYWEPFGREGRKIIEENFDIAINNAQLEKILLGLTGR